MNFLTSALNTFTGGSIPYNFGDEQVPDPNETPSIWKLYHGTKKDDGTPCTIFSFDIKRSPQLLPLAQNASKKLRSMRLPNVLKVLDTFENDSNVYIVSERVTPLAALVHGEDLSNEVKLYVIYSIAKALKYINVEGSSVLGHIDLNNVFLNSSGEPRLGGFEVCTNLKSDPDQPIYRNSAQLPGFREFLSPEVSQNGVDVLKGPQTVKFDSWKLGTLIYRLFNDGVSPSSNEDLNRANNIPKVLVPAYKKLLSSSLTVRATPEAFLKNGENSFFGTKLIYFARDLEEFSFKTEDEKLQIFQTVESIKDELPVGLLENKLLPDLIAFQSQYPAHVSQIIRLILSLCGSVSNETHIKLINPIIIKAFTLPDRAIRVLLLGTLPKYIDLLTKSQVSDNIFNNFVTGFSDSNPAIREETIKATLFIVPKLSDRQLNNDLLRFLAKTQSDEKPQIRTNTTILIGKIAQHLNKSSRSNVLATAFGKALKDPFIHSRIAAILALSSSIEYFTPDVISNKILTVIAPSLLDKSSKVREEAQKSFDLFFQKIKEEAAKLPIDSYDDGEVGSDQVVKEVTENVANFGMISGTFNKLTSGLSGSLNQENSITPESSRTGTPGVIASFDRYQQNGADSANAATSHQVSKPTGEYNSWGNDDFDVEEEDDGWGMGDLEVDDSKITSKIIKPATFVAPKVTGLATETTKKPLSSRTSSFGTSAAPKKKGLQLKPKSKLKLDLDAGDDNGWDDGW